MPRWYSVVATYKAVHAGPSRKRHLWERIIFLVRAEDDEEAVEVGRAAAKAKEHGYRTEKGYVDWAFQEIEAVLELFDDQIKEGTEVFWEFFERVDKAQQGGSEPSAGP